MYIYFNNKIKLFYKQCHVSPTGISKNPCKLHLPGDQNKTKSDFLKYTFWDYECFIDGPRSFLNHSLKLTSIVLRWATKTLLKNLGQGHLAYVHEWNEVFCACEVVQIQAICNCRITLQAVICFTSDFFT